MSFIDLKNIKEKEIIPGYRAKFLHSENMTFANWEIDAGSDMPEHSHQSEQVSYVLEGEFELCIDGTKKIMKPGLVATIPSDVKHSGKAITNCKILDIFYPLRKEYK